MKNNALKVKTENIINLLLFVYLISINIKLINNDASAIIQNISYLGLLFLSFIKLRHSFTISPFDILFLLFYSFACLSLFWTESIENTISILRIIGKVFVLCVFLPKFYNRSSELSTKLLKIIFFSYFIVILYLLIDLILFKGFSHFYYLGEDFGLDSVRLTVRAALCCSIGLFLYKKEENKVYLYIDIFLIGISLFTGKRTGFLFLAIFFVLYEIITNRNTLSKKLRILLISIVIFAVTIIAVFNVDVLYRSIGIRIETAISTIVFHTAADKSTLQRQILLENAMKLFKMHPIRGNGINAVRTYLNYVDFYHVTYSHNNFAELLAGVGIIGMVLYYSVYLYGFFSYAKISKSKTRTDKSFPALCFSVLMAYFLCDFLEVTYESYFEILMLSIFVNFTTGLLHAKNNKSL